MTLTLSALIEWRRQELESPDLQHPPTNFLPDLKEYLRQIRQDAGPNPALWPEDCEPFAARSTMEDIFRLRRAKLARSAELYPDVERTSHYMLPFENQIWERLTGVYKTLDDTYKSLCITGKIPGGNGGRP